MKVSEDSRGVVGKDGDKMIFDRCRIYIDETDKQWIDDLLKQHGMFFTNCYIIPLPKGEKIN